MKIRFFILASFFVTSLQAQTEIKNPLNRPISKTTLLQQVKEVRNFFTMETGLPTGELVISIDPEGCFRTGYNLKTKDVRFCSSDRVLNRGLDSIDVIRHELFHAFLCGARPELCMEKEREDAHEALADYFAYLMSGDEVFGEYFYVGVPFLRRYSTTWKPRLVREAHERGNAIVSELIAKKSTLRDALANVFSLPIDDGVSYTVRGVDYSILNRYRLSPGKKMEIEFRFSEDVERVVWRDATGMGLQATGPMSFSIALPQNFSSKKVYATFLSASGDELGRWSFYFGPAL